MRERALPPLVAAWLLIVAVAVALACAAPDLFVRDYARAQGRFCDGGAPALEACDLDDACEARVCR